MRYKGKHKHTFMRWTLAFVAVLTIAFTCAMIWVYLQTGQEMATLTERFYTVIVCELGGLIVKVIFDNFGRKKDDNDD